MYKNKELVEEILSSQYTLAKLNARAEETQSLSLNDLKVIPLSSLYKYGFINWDDQLLLVPPWAFRLVISGEEFCSINNELRIKGTHIINSDTRAGVMAYGFFHPELPKNAGVSTQPN